jgi:arsenite methyltransferase
MTPDEIVPPWLLELLGVAEASDGAEFEIAGRSAAVRDGIVRMGNTISSAQEQTSNTFGFKWAQRDTFESAEFRARTRAWLLERYGDVEHADWWETYGERPLVLDAGCGAGLTALELLARRLDRVRYVGADISEAVDVAAARFAEHGLSGAFIQADVLDLPFAQGQFDVVLSEGVLHHTDSTERAFRAVARLVAPGGRFLFYVYRRKGPIREFTDDYLRELLQPMEPSEAWEALMPLTRLGQALGELGVEVDVPEDIDLLGIPAGVIDIQRLFYWHVFKAYHRPGYSLEELNHINFDWYAPKNAHRQSIEEVRGWCVEAGLEIERENVQEAGITIVARKLR